MTRVQLSAPTVDDVQRRLCDTCERDHINHGQLGILEEGCPILAKVIRTMSDGWEAADIPDEWDVRAEGHLVIVDGCNVHDPCSCLPPDIYKPGPIAPWQPPPPPPPIYGQASLFDADSQPHTPTHDEPAPAFGWSSVTST